MSPDSVPAGTTASSLNAPAPFECGWKLDAPGAARVHVRGELDLATVPAFREALREAQLGGETVSIDLRELELIDCAALAAIVEADAVARRQGRRVVLVNGSGQVGRVLALTGLLEATAAVDSHPVPVPTG